MIRSKKTEWLCLGGIALAVLLSIALLLAALAFPSERTVEKDRVGIGTDYADALFDTSYVHTINLLVSDLNWKYMIDNATSEAYVLCDAIIDGNRIEKIALRPKGNSSLTSIDAMGSEHFSFKIEFDLYHVGNTYLGLDKLSLNNLSGDPTCMKDYFSYRLQQEVGAVSPLCTYTLLQVNGEDFGLYLAVEGVEDSFALRNYGDDVGQLYKPEIYAMNSIFSSSSATNGDENGFGLLEASGKPGERIESLAVSMDAMFADRREDQSVAASNYVGDDPKPYAVIFDSAVFDLANEQKARYMEAVKTLCASESPLDALDLDQMIPYFAANNFVVNYDGYIGASVHNFYLRESGGKLSLIPWDYNLAFGAFTMEGALESMLGDTEYAMRMDNGKALTAEESAVNYPIDTPMQVAENRDRPLFGAWIDDEAAHAAYYETYRRLMENYFDSGRFAAEYETVYQLIHPYVARGLTFYQANRFERGAENLRQFCLLRAESIRGQIEGRIPATKDGQMERPETLLPTGDLNLGQTIDFSGLVMGISSEDVLAVLDAINGDGERSLENVASRIQGLREDSSALPSIVVDVVQNSPFVARIVLNIVATAILLLLSILVLWIGLRLVKRPRWR